MCIRDSPKGVVVGEGDRDLVQRDGQVRLWWERTPIDLFFSYHAFHEHAAARVRVVPFGDVEIPVLNCTDLAICKAMFARAKDWVDIENAAHSGSIDAVEALTWVERMLGADSPNHQRLTEVLANPRDVNDDGIVRFE